MRVVLARHRDLLLAAAFLVFGAAELVAGGSYDGRPTWPGPTWVAVAALLATTLPLAVRRTRPLVGSLVPLASTATYTLVAGGAEATSGFLAVVVAVFSGAAYARRPWVVAVVAGAAMVVHNLGDPSVRSAADWFWSLGLLTVSLLLGLAVRDRQIRIVSLEHEAEAMAREHDARVALATAAERAAIARELHDVVAHAVSVVVVQAQVGSRALADDPPVTGRALEVIEDTGRSALADLRRLLQVLSDDGAPVDPSPGLAHLGDLVARFRDAGLDVTLDSTVRGDTPALSGAADLAAYRLVQEALTNTVRHAPGSRARVRVAVGEHRVVVSAEDDGPGLPGAVGGPASRGAGRGLIGMRERVRLAGGEVVECGASTHGFRVVASLPCP